MTDGTVISGRLHEMSFDGLELDTGDGGWRVLVPETVRQLKPMSILCKPLIYRRYAPTQVACR